ncbi:hypothetical protein AGMMS50212_00230 [Spirochaetia bacterium]|nr:hypothetical protein AGMMS50212_00230 [Spirochaetia bacterium]
MANLSTVSEVELQEIMPTQIYSHWLSVIHKIRSLYDMDEEWDKGGKTAKNVLRFRRGGKTLVSLFPKEDGIGLMVVLGKDEREKFESTLPTFNSKVVKEYESARTYHDGKWIMFNLPDQDVENDLPVLLALKRKPNRKDI